MEFVRENALPQDEIRRRRNQELDHVLELIGTMNGRFTPTSVLKSTASTPKSTGQPTRFRRASPFRLLAVLEAAVSMLVQADSWRLS